MNTKGFTLMEILAVLLILAVVVMFAIPGIRAVRNEIYYQQAKSAAVKMAEAMRSYYQNTKGVRINTGVLVGKLPLGDAATGVTSVMDAAQASCRNDMLKGFPPSSQGNTTTSNMSQLFACEYLSVKDFVGLPYRFDANDELYRDNSVLVRTVGLESAGTHQNEGWCVYKDSSVAETNEHGACPHI